MAKKYVGSKTLEAFMQIVKTALNEKVDITKIVATLDSEASDQPLAASQGKALKDMIEAIGGTESGGVAQAENALKFGGELPEAYVMYADVLKTLETYDADTDASKAVAASLVKALKDQVEGMVAKDAEGNPLPDGKVNDSDKLDGKDAADFVQRTDVVSDWTNYDENAEVAQVVAAALIKAIADKVDSMLATDEEGNAVVGKAKDSEKLGGFAPEHYATAEQLKTQVTDQKGVANGLATLDEGGKIPAENLPAYVDDVIEVYMVNSGTEDAPVLKAYADETHQTEVTGERGKIYIDITDGKRGVCYRWSGTVFTEICKSEDMVEITEEEILAMWEEVKAESATPAE